MDIVGIDSGAQSAIDIVAKHVFFKPNEGHGWRSKPELPTSDEILMDSDIDQLPKNPVDVTWASKDEYLAAQYEILRCEAIEGLRRSVRSFVTYYRKPPMMDDDYTNIYTQVRIKEYVMSTIGPLTRVSFSTERSKYRIQWQQSKRLQPGKIVALSPKNDGFRKICKIATIAQRPYYQGLDQDPPLVDLLWANPEDAVLDPNLEMVMIESLNGYFESARHALIGLQHAAQTDSPLDKYLTGVHAKDQYPTFLKEDPILDVSTLASRATPDDAEVVAKLKTHNILNSEVKNMQSLTWLDESQLLGLHRIVSKELAIVQGPPGTGKTHTSVQAIKIMVANRRRHRGPPIVIAAQTNHALDQILAQCIQAGANILRMGGRTQSDLIKPHTLFEHRQKCQGKIPADNKCRPVDAVRRINARKIQDLVDGVFSDRLLDPDLLLEFGIITAAQHRSLVDDTMETHEAVEVHGPFALWLGDSLIPAKIREDRHPTQLELNEAEARKNLPEFECDDDEELENIAYDDEDLYRFRGQTITPKHVWSGKDPARLTSWDRAVRRALQTDDLFTIDRDLRGAVYQHFQARVIEAMTPKFAALLAENIELCKKRKAYRFLGNTQIVQRQGIDIVGCTTTGLSKYRGSLAAMQPQSLLIEEAAETREANIVSALYPSLQQLILVGDHKQLAPKCDIAELGEAPYNLNVSLFQRLVNLDMSFVMLKQQRRMKSELRSLLNPFYPELFDHPSVESINNRPDVLGMGGVNSWLFDHTWPEDVNSDFSKFNEQEAEMVTNFFAYLVANGTPAERITVLTFYKGQRKVLLRKLRRHPTIMGSVFNVCTVDSYQGEENDIILLSLVRSPQLDRSYAVGFLEDERRAVVAISRARRGFYVFGNVDNVLGAHQASYDLWYKICAGFATQGRIDRDRGLPIVCQPHGTLSWIKEIEDWGDRSGGCDKPCNQTRHCGHPCTLKCHAIAHEDLPCSQPCSQKLACGHGCQKLCGQKCFCDCKTFEDIHRPTQVVARPHLSLEEKMLQMGAPPTEMLLASQNHRNASLQQSQPASAPSSQYRQPQRQCGIKGTRRGQQPAAPVYNRMAQADAQWEDFVANVAFYDERLRQEHLASIAAAGEHASETVIKEIYQPTALVNGQRAGGGDRRVQEVPLFSNQVAAVDTLTNGEQLLIPDLQDGFADLSLTNGSQHYLQNGNPANLSMMADSSIPNGQPTQLNGSTNGAPGPYTNLQQDPDPPIQQVQQSVQYAPVQLPMKNDLLGDPFPGDMPTMAETNGALGALPRSEATSNLLNQFWPLIPPPAAGAVPINDTLTTASASGLAELGEQKNGKDEEEEEEEDWLIQF